MTMMDNKVTLSIDAPSLVLLVDVEMMNNKDIVVYEEEEALLIGKGAITATNMTTITGNRKNNNVLSVIRLVVSTLNRQYVP